MEKHKTCSFFGHQKINIDERLKTKLKEIAEQLILDGFTTFCFGGFSNFDELSRQTITELKQKYPHIKRIFYLYNPKQYKQIKAEDVDCDELIYPDLEFDWWYKRIYFRNVEMIKNSDFIIFYVKNTQNSGAYKAYKYAIKKKKNFLNIAEE